MNYDTENLRYGIFWVISDSDDIYDYKLIVFDIPCDRRGHITEMPDIPLNSKNGANYNHRQIWQDIIKNNSCHRPYNKRACNYYPRGRVEISNGKATIYLNQHINTPIVIDEIKWRFGLSEDNISAVRVINDNSAHYRCFMDWSD